jgi:hypothetical protein
MEIFNAIEKAYRSNAKYARDYVAMSAIRSTLTAQGFDWAQVVVALKSLERAKEIILTPSECRRSADPAAFPFGYKSTADYISIP